MSYMAVAIGGSAVLSAWSSSRGSSKQESATKRGIRSNEMLSREERAFQREMWETSREDFEPWREVGEVALQRINDGIQTGTFDPPRFAPEDIELRADPGYQFRLDEGRKAIEASAAAKGGLMSGGFARGLTRYAQDYASNEYQNAYGRYVDDYNRETDRRRQRFNMLNMLSSQGLSASSGQAGANTQLASASNNITQNQASRTQSGYNALGQIAANEYADYANILNQGIQNVLTYNAMSSPGTVSSNQTNSFPVTPGPRTNQWANSPALMY